MDTTIFLDINRFAQRTAFAHGVLRALAGTVGLVVLAVLLVVGVAEARRNRDRPALTTAGLTVLAAAVTLGLGEAIGHGLDRATPARRLHGIEVLLGGPNGFSLPDLHAALAAALLVALLVAGARVIGILTVVIALLMAFAGVYVGAHFPLDELAGLGLGLLVALLAFPLLRHDVVVGEPRGTVSLASELAGFGEHVGTMPHSGPAARPVPLAATGSVRLLSVDDEEESASEPTLRAASSVAAAAAAATAAASKPTSPTTPNSQRPRPPVGAVAPRASVTIPAPDIDPAGERRGPVTILPRGSKPAE